MTITLRKTLALFLCLTMCLSLFPASAFASEYTEEEFLIEDSYTEEYLGLVQDEILYEEPDFEQDTLDPEEEWTEETFFETEEDTSVIELLESEALPDEAAREETPVSFADTDVFNAGDELAQLLSAIEDANTDSYELNGSINDDSLDLTIPAGFTLTIAGEMIVGSLTVNGTVETVGSGYLDVNGHAEINGAVYFTNSEFRAGEDRPSVFYQGQPTLGQNAVFSIASQSAVVFMYSAENYGELVDAASAAAGVAIPNADTGISIPDDLNFEIPAGESVTISANTVLNIDGSSKLVNNGTINLNDGHIMIFGCLQNNGTINLRPTGDLLFGWMLANSRGKYEGYGAINIYDSADEIPVDEYIAGLNLAAFGVTEIVGGVRLSFDTSELFTELQNACIENWDYLNLNDVGDFVIESDITIPAGTTVSAKRDRVIVPEGVTLTIEGELLTTGLRIEEGGAVIVDGSQHMGHVDAPSGVTVLGLLTLQNYAIFDTSYNTWLRVNKENVTCSGGGRFCPHFETQNEDEVADAIATIIDGGLNEDRTCEAIVEIRFPFTAGTINEVPSHTRLRAYAGVYIPEGVTFTVNAESIFAAFNENIEIDGNLVNNGTINLNQEGGRPAPLANLGATGTYTAGEGARLNRMGNPYVLIPQSEKLVGLKQAIADELNGYEMNGLGDVVLDEDITIPANMSVKARDNRFIVPNGVTLTVRGELLTTVLLIEDGGKVIADGSHMDIPVGITIEGTGNFELKNHAMIDTGIGPWYDMDKSKTTIENGSRFCPHFETQNEDQVLDAIATIIHDGLNEDPTCEAIVEIRFPFTVDRVTEVPPHTRLRTYEGAYIPADKTFTVSAHSIFAIFNEDLVIDGSLVNNGTVNLNGPKAVLNGSYTQGEGGEVFRNGQPFTIGTKAQLLEQLEQAVADQSINYYDIRNFGDFELTNGLTVDHNFKLEAYGTNLIVPSGKTLTITNGARFELHNLVVEQGAGVVIEDNGYLNTYDSFVLNGTLTAGNNVRMHIPADTNRNSISFGSNCDINVHFRPETEEQLYSMLEYAETLEGPFYPDIRPEFAWTVTGPVTFNRVHLSVNYKRGNLVIADGGELTANGGIYMDGAALIVENGGKLINNDQQIELDEVNGSMASLHVDEGGIYTGTGRIIVKNVGTDSADSYITGLNLTRFNKYYDEGWHGTAYVDTGAILDGLRQAIDKGESYYNLNHFGTIPIEENEMFLIPEGMRVDAWGTTLVVPATSTLNVIGEYSGSGLELYGNFVMGKAEVDWDKNSSNVNIRDTLILGENASIGVGLQSNLRLPAYAVTDSVIKNQITRVDPDSTWIALNWNAFDNDTLDDAIRRSPTLPDGYNGHADIRFGWVVNGEVNLPNKLDLFVDGAYDNGSITVPEGAKLTNNNWITLNGTTLNVAGALVNNDNIRIERDEYGDNNTGFGSINVTGSYSGSGRITIPYEADVNNALGDLDINQFLVRDIGWAREYTLMSGDIYADFKTACESDYSGTFDLRNLGDFTITEDIGIPNNMRVEAWGTNIVIPSGRNLWVNGNLNADRITVNGNLLIEGYGFTYAGTVVIGDDGHINLRDYGGLHTEYSNSPDVLSGSKVTFDAEDNADMTSIGLLADSANDAEFNSLWTTFKALGDHYCGKIRVNYDKVLTDNLDAFAVKGVQIEVRQSLTVGEGVRFDAAFLDIIGGTVTVNGVLVTHEELKMQPDDGRDLPTGTISFTNDTCYVNDGGYFYVTGVDNENDDPNNHIAGLNFNRFSCEPRDDGLIYRDTSAIFDAFEAACAAGEGEFNLHDLGSFTISRSVTVPANMRVDASGTVIVVPSGVTLTVEGNMFCDGTVFFGGDVVVSGRGYFDLNRFRELENGRPNGTLTVSGRSTAVIEAFGLEESQLLDWITLTTVDNDVPKVSFRYTISNPDSAYEAVRHARMLPDPFIGRLRLICPATIDERVDLVNPKPVEIAIDQNGGNQNGSLTIANGGSLNAYNIIARGATITVNGVLASNADITLQNQNGQDAHLAIDGGQLRGMTHIYVNDSGNPASCISGIADLQEGMTNDSHNTVFYSRNGFFEAFKTACATDNLPDFRNLRDLGEFTILSNVELPGSSNPYHAENTTIIIPENVSVINRGALFVDTLTVNGEFHNFGNLGARTLNANGKLSLINRSTGETLNINNNWNVSVIENTEDEHAVFQFANINYSGNAGIRLFHNVGSTDALAAALGNVGANTNEHQEDHIRLFLPEGQTWTLAQDLEIPVNANVHVHESMQVDPGVTLTVNGHMVLEEGQYGSVDGALVIGAGDGHVITGRNASLTVNGSLINNGRLSLQEHDNDMPALTANGSYSGTGVILVNDKQSPASYISGLDLNQFVSEEKNNGIEYTRVPNLLSVSSETVRRGNEVNVSVSLSEGSNAHIIQFVLCYDPEVLRYKSASKGAAVSSAPTIGNSEGRISFNVVQDTSLDGTLLDATFETIADSDAGDTRVYILTDTEDERDQLVVQRNENNVPVDVPVACIDGTVSILDYQLGDVNDDGQINVMDAFMIRRYQARQIDLTGTQKQAAEVSGDGRVNITDAFYIRQYAIELIDTFPAAR